MAKVLSADDSAFARLNCKKVLARGGHDVLEAASGFEALALYKSERPDVVFLDITMPDMDGLAALEEIIKFDAEARIAMATAMGQRVFGEALPARTGADHSGQATGLDSARPDVPEKLLGLLRSQESLPLSDWLAP